jgi:Ca-activated chloride channel family protein
MSFGSPKILWLLLVFPPALLAFFWWSARVRQKLMAQFIQSRLLPGLIAGVSAERQKIRAALIIGSVVCFILALARPQWGYFQEEIAQKGLDIVVVVDTSKSMLATDITPNRLARAKLAALDLMQRAQSDRLGLVAFAGSAFLECPLTIDDSAFQQSVQALDVNTISEGGTAIGDAIDEAARAFKEGDNYKVIVLFTDGEDNDTGALEAAQRAGKAGIHIYTVGIGTAAGELLQIRDADGNLQYIRDEQGNVVKSHLNEALLRQISDAAGGSYYSLSGANTMDALYQRSLASLPRSQGREQWLRRPHERYHWPLALGIILLIAEVFFPERRPPSRSRANSHQGQSASAVGAASPSPNTSAAIVVMLLLLLPTATHASVSSAMRDYNAGNFTNALQEFEALINTNKPDPRLIFNAGDAAYRATNYDAALELFNIVLTSPDVKLQQKAYYNIGAVQYHQGEQAKDLDGVEILWKKSLQSFQNAATLDKTDADAAHNVEYVKQSLVMIEELRRAALAARQEAESSVRQRNYHRALDIMEQAVQKNIAAKQFQDYVKRLKDIDEIATPHQH